LKELETMAQAGAPLQLLLKNPQGFESSSLSQHSRSTKRNLSSRCCTYYFI